MKTLRVAAVIAMLLGRAPAPAIAQEARVAGKPAAAHTGPGARPPDWGTGATTYDNIGAAEFLPTNSISTYGTFVSPAGRYATSSGAYFQATPHLPGGALLTYLEFDYCDSDTFDAMSLTLYDCDYLGICANQIGYVQSPVSPADCPNYVWVDLTPANYTVSNNSRRLYLEIVTDSGGIDKSFYGAIVGYKLQVSQPPPTPSFNDVPVTDFGYQYIEALYASGITGGCGGGAFCPDSPVTRRQMAIFIAKALGLSWSGY